MITVNRGETLLNKLLGLNVASILFVGGCIAGFPPPMTSGGLAAAMIYVGCAVVQAVSWHSYLDARRAYLARLRATEIFS